MSSCLDQQSTTDAPNLSPASHRAAVLDESARQTLVTLVSAGFSRRAAAHWVGCSPSTVTRTAQRDPAFAERLGQASRFMQLEALQGIRKALANPRYWRAAAWFLERTNSDDFGPRPTSRYAERATLRMFEQFIPMFLGEVPRRNLRRVLKKLEAMMREHEIYIPSTDPPEFRDSVDDMLDESDDDSDEESDEESDAPNDLDASAGPQVSAGPAVPSGPTAARPSEPPQSGPTDWRSLLASHYQTEEAATCIRTHPAHGPVDPEPAAPSSFCNNPPVSVNSVASDDSSTTDNTSETCDSSARHNPCNTNQDALHKPPDSG